MVSIEVRGRGWAGVTIQPEAGPAGNAIYMVQIVRSIMGPPSAGAGGARRRGHASGLAESRPRRPLREETSMPQHRDVAGTEPDAAPPEINAGVAHPARVYDYWLGGKDNFPADRDLAEKMIQAIPNMRAMAHANRAFMGRAVRHLAREAGVRQFLDIGTGIPTSPNLHEVAQAVAPDTRVVYVDNDPIVLVHARALMAGPGRGAT